MSEKPAVVEHRLNRSPNPTVNKPPDGGSLVMSHDQSKCSKGLCEHVKNLNEIDRFFGVHSKHFSEFGSKFLPVPCV